MVLVELIAKQINSYAALAWLNEGLTKFNDELDRFLKSCSLAVFLSRLVGLNSY